VEPLRGGVAPTPFTHQNLLDKALALMCEQYPPE